VRSLGRKLRGPLAPVLHASRILFAMVWRRLMFRTTVIAITGSVGKTTAKECLAAILEQHARTFKTPGNANGLINVPRVLCGLRPWHRYAVIEVATASPGQIAHSARLVKPDIAIVLHIAGTHRNAFPTLEDMAAEKATLLDYLPRDGIAILNGDDPLVREMADRCTGKVIFFGQSSDCDVVAEDVSSRWPERLQFTLSCEDERVPVRTKLVGTHWLNSALAALAAAQTCGVPLEDAAAAIATVAPYVARMQPVALPNGAVVIRDEETGSPDTLEAMVKVLSEARAQRRVLVFSDLEGVTQKARRRLRDPGRMAAELTDLALFVGEYGYHGVRHATEAGMDPANCHHLVSLRAAADLLKSELRAGDLVFVKGRGLDHLTRIIFAQYGEIGCWTTSCRLGIMCDSCSRLKPGFDLEEALSTPIRILAGEELIPVSAQGRETAAAD
jgi:UDP-N-acetylmuramoyl-tripeptide--D-alanyl-D-alanine ligase